MKIISFLLRELIIWSESLATFRNNSVVALGSAMIIKTDEVDKVYFPVLELINKRKYLKEVQSLKKWHIGYCFLGVSK